VFQKRLRWDVRNWLKISWGKGHFMCCQKRYSLSFALYEAADQASLYRLLFLVRTRQRETKRRSLARSSLSPDASAVALHNTLADGQAQTSTRVVVVV
jgi:hypothetical protein